MAAGKAVPCWSGHVQLHTFPNITDKEQRACLVLQESSRWRMRAEPRQKGVRKDTASRETNAVVQESPGIGGEGSRRTLGMRQRKNPQVTATHHGGQESKPRPGQWDWTREPDDKEPGRNGDDGEAAEPGRMTSRGIHVASRGRLR